MPNDLYKQMVDKTQGGIGGNFFDFMNQMRGQNPDAIINKLVQSGQISQQQLNAVQRRAQEMSGFFGQFKKKFGF